MARGLKHYAEALFICLLISSQQLLYKHTNYF